MSSHWWWHPKSLTSTPPPLPHHGTSQHQWAAVWFLWWLSIILDNVSQWQSRPHFKVIFTPTVGHVQVRARAESFIILRLPDSSSISLSVSLLMYLKDTRNRKGHSTPSCFLRYMELSSVKKMCQCRCHRLDLKMCPSFPLLTSRLHQRPATRWRTQARMRSLETQTTLSLKEVSS